MRKTLVEATQYCRHLVLNDKTNALALHWVSWMLVSIMFLLE